jgi:molecular chaperone DnaK
MATDNKSLARFILDGILPAPRGVPQVGVTFDIDANGIVKVSAKDQATGKSQDVTIQASSGLDDTEVERLRNEAEQHAAEDLEKREAVELRNTGDSLAYSAEKLLRDNADNITDDLKAPVEAAIADLRTALQGTDTSAIREQTEALSQAMQSIGQAIYGQAGATSGDGATPSGDGAAEDSGEGEEAGTIEGEFREV